MLKSQAIAAFLKARTHPDLAELYSLDMEVQVNVIKADGKKVDLGQFKGKARSAYTNGILTWKPIRIPYNANTEPEFTDSDQKYPLELYAEGIGMTGWDWKARVSRWVAFDFDAILGHSDAHSKKLTDSQLAEITAVVQNVPFVTLRKSTSGKGLHLYVFLKPVATANHNEHAALARAILAMLSGLTGYDFSSKVDICGGNMWVWHQKMYRDYSKLDRNDGLELIKQGIMLEHIPDNWRDHINVVSKKTRRTVPQFVYSLPEDHPDRLFQELTGQRSHTSLDTTHRALIEYLAKNNCAWWWDTDNHMLVTHTYHLLEAHKELHLCGPYNTLAQGTERGADHNCFMFPLLGGAWTVRRFSQGVKEADSWEQDGKKWTRCFYNREPDLQTMARLHSGIEHQKGGYIFRKSTEALQVLRGLGIQLELPETVRDRPCHLIYKKRECKVVVTIDSVAFDNAEVMKEWHLDRKKWTRIFNTKLPENVDMSEVEGQFDNFIRHISTNNLDSGWLLKRETGWSEEPLTNITLVLKSMAYDQGAINQILGGSVMRAWNVVNKPFQPEYTGNREWNRDAAQFAIAPSLDLDKLNYPNWTKVLEHCGTGLDEGMKTNAWCIENGITKGSEFLMLWIASMFKYPTSPTTYLAFWGPQDSGKSIFHEAISQILITKGAMNANNALQNQSNFNRELLNSVLCYVEEIDLNADKQAYNKIKDWVTSPFIQIHEKGQTPYMVRNCTHWVSASNQQEYVPVFDGDTRITMIRVPPLSNVIPKPELMAMLTKEAPDFLAEIMALEIPRSDSRLLIPTIETETKERAMAKNRDPLEEFIQEEMFEIPGAAISADDFHVKMQFWLDPRDRGKWSKNMIGRKLPERIPRGRLGSNQLQHYGNLTDNKDAIPGARLILRNKHYLVTEKEPEHAL